MHVEIDPAPHVLTDDIGIKLVAPEANWRGRRDMHPQGTAPFRASIVGRARFIEDFVTDQSKKGVRQYVMLGAGLDTFAQRSTDVGSGLHIFEIDKPDTVAWKRQRLIDTGYPPPPWLHLVPVDFESNVSWWDQLLANGFDAQQPAVITSIGVSMYLTLSAIQDTLRLMKRFAPGSTFIMTFMLPLETVNAQDQAGYQMAIKGAQASGTPFISFFTPPEMLKLAREIGFQKVEHLSTMDLIPRYFAGRTDGLKPSSGEEFLIVTV